MRSTLLFLLVLSMLVCPAAAQPAAVCPAPAPEDMAGAVVFGNGTPASCTQAALQALITAGGKITCNCGPQPYTLTLTATLTVPNRLVVIDGQNRLTISGNNSVRIFDKLAAANAAGSSLLALQNLRLINGKAPYLNTGNQATEDVLGGGAIRGRAYGSLKVINVEFDGNGGPLSQSDACGAVHTIVYQDIVFAGCTFRRNRAANGGAVGTIGSAQRFLNCVFEDNAATGTGGTFSLGGSGGAVYVDGVNQNGVTNEMSLCGCVFRRNTAGYQAGAVNIIFYAGEGSRGSIDRCSFETNSCAVDKGGALYYMNGPLVLSNSTFANNTSPGIGGGAWVNNTLLSLTNSTFAGNQANNNQGGGLGGGLAIDGSGTEKRATITNCTFSGNRAGNFASALFNGGELTLSNSVFHLNLTGTTYQSNPYGGGTINKGSSLTVGAGNLQWPETYSAPFGAQREDWLTPAVLVADAQLLPLADNGGPTRTQALPATSPAKDRAATGAPATDQRGYPRQGPPDSGAYEYSIAGPLPVTLLDLAVARQGDAAVVRWSTTRERNNAGFVVERATDGRHFARLGRVPAAGGGHYEFTDPAASPATSYYRLRQVDFDGTETLSPVVTLAADGAGPQWKLVPNPAAGRVHLRGVPAATAVQVLGLGGQVLRAFPAGTATLDLRGLLPGVYVVQPAGQRPQRLVVQP